MAAYLNRGLCERKTRGACEPHSWLPDMQHAPHVTRIMRRWDARVRENAGGVNLERSLDYRNQYGGRGEGREVCLLN